MRGVHHGTEVLDAVFNFAPDVVLLDIGMPQMSGYEVARRLRERYGSARPALIAVTAMTRPSTAPRRGRRLRAPRRQALRAARAARAYWRALRRRLLDRGAR